MIKKIVSIILSILLVLSCVGCGQASSSSVGENVETGAPSVDPTENTPEEVTDAPTEETAPQTIDTDEKLLTVDITFPASFFEGTDMSTFDTDAYVKEQNFLAARINEDGSMVVTMTKGRHKELLDETSANLDVNFASFVEAEDTPYIKEISHNDDFTMVTVKVDRAAYENAFDITPFAIGMSVAFYQMLLDMEYHVEVVMIDIDTGDTITTVIYPDALEG